MAELLNVKDLNVSFMSYAGEVKAVRNVSFSVGERETLAMVGESGCGKTVTSKSIMRLLGRTTAVIKEGSSISFKGDHDGSWRSRFRVSMRYAEARSP